MGKSTCSICEEEKLVDELGKCVFCNEIVCLDCVVPMTSTRTVDFTLCTNCEFKQEQLNDQFVETVDENCEGTEMGRNERI